MSTTLSQRGNTNEVGLMADGNAVYVESAPAASLRERGEGSSTQLETSLHLWKDSGIKKTSPAGVPPLPFRCHLELSDDQFEAP